MTTDKRAKRLDADMTGILAPHPLQDDEQATAWLGHCVVRGEPFLLRGELKGADQIFIALVVQEFEQ